MSEKELLDKINNDLTFLTSINNNMVEKLFHEIDNYVKSNYLFVSDEDKYYLRYNGMFYVSGFYVGPEIMYYIRISRDKTIDNYVDYEDLKIGRLNKEQQEVKNQIDGINNTINDLKEKGISRTLLKNSIHF